MIRAKRRLELRRRRQRERDLREFSQQNMQSFSAELTRTAQHADQVVGQLRAFRTAIENVSFQLMDMRLGIRWEPPK
jgi:ABC-type phosphate transport system auxiliary subunit